VAPIDDVGISPLIGSTVFNTPIRPIGLRLRSPIRHGKFGRNRFTPFDDPLPTHVYLQNNHRAVHCSHSNHSAKNTHTGELHGPFSRRKIGRSMVRHEGNWW
jgi:hypothetical protein